MEVIGHCIRRKKSYGEDDYHLVQKAVAGDQDAYSALLGRYKRSVFQLMLQRVKNPAEAEDMTMEAFEKAFLNLSSYAPTHAFSTWLFRIAINNCIDNNRKKRLPVLWLEGISKVAGFDSEALKHNFTETLTPEDLLIRQQRTTMVRSLLSRLSVRQRRLIEMRYYEELSYEEIAQQLDLPLGTVKTGLFRARERMQKLLRTPPAQTKPVAGAKRKEAIPNMV